MNNGIDINAAKGGAAKCVAPGTVIHIGSMRGLGQLVIVDHASGYISVYANLQSINVALNEKVDIGVILGKVVTVQNNSKLHFEIRKSTTALDPVEWLEK
jgi:septal ring factor EnvC (AmiA/AmiB activator)